METLAEWYVLLDSLLFKITTTPQKETALLAISEIATDKIITLYHSSLFAGHQGVIKTYLTINDKFFIPNLNTLFAISYIKGYHICIDWLITVIALSSKRFFSGTEHWLLETSFHPANSWTSSGLRENWKLLHLTWVLSGSVSMLQITCEKLSGGVRLANYCNVTYRSGWFRMGMLDSNSPHLNQPNVQHT